MNCRRVLGEARGEDEREAKSAGHHGGWPRSLASRPGNTPTAPEAAAAKIARHGGAAAGLGCSLALSCDPALVLADEPTTALDVTVQAQIIALVQDLQRERGTAIVMITHDLGVVAGLCDEVMVLYGGRVMEQAPADRIFYNPTHPYTRGLLGALPRLEQGDDLPLVAIPGAPPNMSNLPAGCPFSARCELAQAHCVVQRPPLWAVPGPALHVRACHRSTEDVAQTLGTAA